VTLKEKLARLDKTPAPASQTPINRGARPDLSRLLPGTEKANSRGCFWSIRKEFDLGLRHGLFALKDLLEHKPEHLQYAAKDPALGGFALDRLLFFDTETTGLSGGVGTLAFIVGLGYFEGGRFVIEQFFLRRFDEERALLHEFMQHLQRTAAGNGALISFNGKAYDMPLIHNRAVFHRSSDLPAGISHIDLLYAARRLWKNILTSCSLATLESEILQVRRRGDIPSHLIPEIYFRYLRTSDPRPLIPVLHHNQADILSMVTLLTLILRLFANDGAVDSVPIDRIAMGRIHEDLPGSDRAQKFYTEMLKKRLPEDQKKEALLRLARICKKNKDFPAACSLWEQALENKGFSIEPYEELAKACEHHLNDLSRAKQYTQRALENITTLEQLYPYKSYGPFKQSLAWRLQRLERKLGRRSVEGDKDSFSVI
jgi:uncharacterized protein YprB with RNaseH-like and TPR domain